LIVEFWERRIEMSDESLEKQIDKLWYETDAGLYEALGITGKAVQRARVEEDPAKLEEAHQYDARFGVGDTEYAETMTAMAATDFFRDLGRTWWLKFEPKIHDLLCDDKNQEHAEFMTALVEGAKTLAVALAPSLVAQLDTLPSVATILATIAAKKIADSGLEAMCQSWAVAIEKRQAEAEKEESDLAEAGLVGPNLVGPSEKELYDTAD
jgi:hypothetical protein